MSVLEVVAREVRRAAAAARIALAALPLVSGLALLTAGAMWLARGRWMTLPPVLPFVIWLAAVGVGAAIALRVRRRLRARSSTAAVALAIEDEQQLRRGALTGLLEVASEGGPFVGKAAAALGARLAPVAARPAPRHRRRLRMAAVLSAVALAQVLLLATTSYATRADGWRALLNPVDAWRGTLLPALVVDEVPRRLQRGSAATIGIAAPGRSVLTLSWRATGSGWRDTLLAVTGDGRAALVINAVDADLALVADDGRSVSDTAYVRVVDRPFVGDVTIRATYPAYISRPAERLAADAPLRVPAGTRLDIDGHSSAPLEAVALVGEGMRVPLAADGMTFGGRFTPRASGTWSWEARGLQQEIADLPAPLEVEVVADSVPHVEILAPVGEVLVGARGRVMLDILAQDDHAVTGVWLRRVVVDASGKEGPATDVRVSAERASEWIGGATQELDGLALEPGMRLRLQAVARDASPAGHEGLSNVLVLRIPTAEEERRAARDAGEAAVEAAMAAARAQAKLGEQTETAARSRADRDGAKADAKQAQAGQKADQKAMGFEQAEQAKEIAGQQKALQERVNQLEEAARDMEDHLRRAGALDTALARQLQDAQKLLREAMTPEMLAAMEKLEQATQQLDGERTRESLAQLAEQQRRLREALEKSAQMLKRAALEGAMQTMADEARELASEQQRFADSAAGTLPDTGRTGDLARKTQDLAKDMERLRERLQQERAQTGANEAQSAEASAERSEAMLREAQARARDANRPMQGQAQRQQAQKQAADAAQQAAQSMKDAAESMERARQGQVQEWKGELTGALDETVQEMLQLAKEQENLAAQAQQDPKDPNLRSQQSALQQGVQTAQQRLQQQGQKSALVSPRTHQMMEQARQQVAQATREAAQGEQQQRSGQQQAQAMQEAANSLRQAAAQLTRDRERAANAESASGIPELMQHLQQLAQQQGALNGQMQSLMPTPQQGQPRQGLDAGARAQAREIAKSQREVARALDAVADADPTGRAQEMAREARMLAQALDQGAVDPATAARQERLFRRMLDAGRSLEQDQKDESQRRESRAARGIAGYTPPGGPARGRDAARYTVPTWEELRGLSAEERRLVIEYFRRLNAEARP